MDSNNLNMIIGIAEIIFFISLSVLAVYLIISLKKFLLSISKIENEVIEITDQIAPVIVDLKLITDDIRGIVERSRAQFDKIEEVSESLVSKGQTVVKTLDTIQSFSSSSLSNVVNFVSSVSNGFKTFKNKLTENSQLRIKNVN